MQIELNDDQVALLVDLISRNAGDIEFTRDQLEETMGDGLTGMLVLFCIKLNVD